MSEIKKGDLVLVIRTPHKCAERLLGKIYTVANLPLERECQCPVCYERLKGPYVDVKDGRNTLPKSWLKKIEPLGEDTSQPEKESLETLI